MTSLVQEVLYSSIQSSESHVHSLDVEICSLEDRPRSLKICVASVAQRMTSVQGGGIQSSEDKACRSESDICSLQGDICTVARRTKSVAQVG